MWRYRVHRWRAGLLIAALLAFAACDGKSAPKRSVTPAAATSAVAQPAGSAAQTTETPAEPPAATVAPSAAAAPAAAPTPAPLSVSLTPVGSLAVGRGFNADVWEFNGFAYVGTYGYGINCPATGVRIVDVRDPTNPRPVGAVADIAGTSQEDVVVRHVSTPAFTGDLLATGIQRCDRTGQGGVAFYDVTDPTAPVRLAFLATGPARGVHELDLEQQGNRALALLAVPGSESNRGGEGDFRIVDVSDPRKPVELANWGVHSALGVDLGGGIGCNHRIFDHSARAGADPNRVYLSYWDAGVIVLDISDPAAPRVAGRIQYGPDDEGETHSVAESADGRYLLIADEDGVFETPTSLHFQVQTPNGTSQIYGCEALFAKPLASTGVISGEIVAAGSACSGRPLLADVKGRVALVDEGSCALDEQATRLEGAGARAMIEAQSGEPISEPGGKDVDLPVVTIRENDATALKQALAAGTLPVTLPSEKHSSGLRIWDISNLSAPRQVAVYQTPDSTAFPPPGDGAYTIHNPETVANLAFLSWYSDGLRVVDLSDPAVPREVASYLPPAVRNERGAVFPDGTLVWGVHLDGDLVFLSDINGGLYIVRYSVQR